ncbi:glycosyltransferase [Lentisphaerota bacterium ZTH]|nr:glycosyltransferase [Lentisphaerota bacterium ZTH]
MKANETINYTIISTSDLGNGAGIAAFRLHQALKKEKNIKSRMLVSEKLSDDEDVFSIPEMLQQKRGIEAKLIRFFRKVESYLNRGGLQNFFSVNGWYARRCSFFKKADILHFHNIHFHDNNFSPLLFLFHRKKQIWTLHDMWAITGHCIYSGECLNWKKLCGNCRQKQRYIQIVNDRTRLNCLIKKTIYKWADILVTTPSEWLKEIVSESPLMKNKRIVCLPNSGDEKFFHQRDKAALRKSQGISNKRFIILFSAALLEDHRKGIHSFHAALHLIKNDISFADIDIYVLGKPPCPVKFPEDMNVKFFGLLHDRKKIAEIYSISDLVVVPTWEDNLPNVVLESLASGVAVLGFNTGGVPEMVKHGRNGYITSKGNVEQLSKYIKELFEDKAACRKMGKSSLEVYDNNFSEKMLVNRITGILEDRNAAIEDKSADKVYSFDVFDTLITRTTATPKGIFLLMKDILEKEYSDIFPVQLVEEFYMVRVESETFARQLCDQEDISIFDIYRTLQHRFSLPQRLIDILIDLEHKVEYDNTLSIPDNFKIAKQLLDAGERVVLISDMYLSGQHIKLLLRKSYGNAFDNIPLYVSSEEKVCKGSGNLFKLVMAKEGIKAEQLHHYGDNIHADYQKPRELNINATQYKANFPEEFEFSYFNEKSLPSQLIAGAACLAKDNVGSLSQKAHVGISFAGPLLYGFVNDIIEKAIKSGHDKLYFLARDGMVLKRIAETICTHRKINLKCHYVYFARQVLHRAAIFEVTTRELVNATVPLPFLNVEIIAERLGCPCEKFYELLSDNYKEKISSSEQAISGKGIDEAISEIISNDALKNFILENSRKYRKNVIGYMTQCGFFESNKAAIVDVGWTGGMQDSLYKIMRSHNPQASLDGFYLGVLAFSPYTSNSNRKTPI